MYSTKCLRKRTKEVSLIHPDGTAVPLLPFGAFVKKWVLKWTLGKTKVVSSLPLRLRNKPKSPKTLSPQMWALWDVLRFSLQWLCSDVEQSLPQSHRLCICDDLSDAGPKWYWLKHEWRRSKKLLTFFSLNAAARARLVASVLIERFGLRFKNELSQSHPASSLSDYVCGILINTVCFS